MITLSGHKMKKFKVKTFFCQKQSRKNTMLEFKSFSEEVPMGKRLLLLGGYGNIYTGICILIGNHKKVMMDVIDGAFLITKSYPTSRFWGWCEMPEIKRPQ